MIKLSNLYKLFTREDAGNLHKTLGTMCLLHFVYRMAYDPIFDTSYSTPMLALMHFVLSISSLIFHLPANRIKGAPMMWPLFRLHSIIFATRSVLVALIVWAWQRHILPNEATDVLKGVSVMGTLIAADIVTRTHRQVNTDTTMRDMPFPTATPGKLITIANYFYSASQILATMNMLYATTVGSPFMLLFPIQIAAFLMTLVRKGIITSGMWHIVYALALGYNYYYGYMIDASPSGLPYWGTALAIAIGRFRYRIDKYYLWAFAIGVYMSRTSQ